MKKGKKKLLAHGYHEIGMDHFALESDGMYQSFQAWHLASQFYGLYRI